jgi:hypothetical protein
MRLRSLLNDLKDWAGSEMPVDIVVQSVEQTRFQLSKRVFNSSQGTKDVKGQALGTYSNSYAKVRMAAGRQTKVVDLVFEGDLQNSIETVRNGQRIVLAVKSQKEREKIKNLELQYKKNIFDLSKDEKDDMVKRIKTNLEEDFKSILNDYK